MLFIYIISTHITLFILSLSFFLHSSLSLLFYSGIKFHSAIKIEQLPNYWSYSGESCQRYRNCSKMLIICGIMTQIQFARLWLPVFVQELPTRSYDVSSYYRVSQKNFPLLTIHSTNGASQIHFISFPFSNF